MKIQKADQIKKLQAQMAALLNFALYWILLNVKKEILSVIQKLF